jgi:hypothetical protein
MLFNLEKSINAHICSKMSIMQIMKNKFAYLQSRSHKSNLYYIMV